MPSDDVRYGRVERRTPGALARRDNCMRTLIVSVTRISTRSHTSHTDNSALLDVTYLMDDRQAPPSYQRHHQLETFSQRNCSCKLTLVRVKTPYRSNWSPPKEVPCHPFRVHFSPTSCLRWYPRETFGGSVGTVHHNLYALMYSRRCSV